MATQQLIAIYLSKPLRSNEKCNELVEVFQWLVAKVPKPPQDRASERFERLERFERFERL
jgi:hypothetical protein